MEEIQHLDYSCKNCTRYIGNGPNLWVRISNNSIIAADPENFDWAQGAFREDTKESLGAGNLEGSILVTRSCADCNKRLGLRCVRAQKAEMVGYVNQYIVRAPAITAKIRGTTDLIPINIRSSSPSESEEVGVNTTENVEIANSTSEAPTRTGKGVSPIPPATQASTITHQRVEDPRNVTAAELQDTNMLLNIIQRQQNAIDELTRNYDNLRRNYDGLRTEVNALTLKHVLGPQSQANKISTSTARSMGSLPSRPSPLNPASRRSTEDMSMSDSPPQSPAPPTSAQSAIIKSTEQPLNSSSIGLDTQQYLQTTVPDYDMKDSDYIPPGATEQEPSKPATSMVGGTDWRVSEPSTPGPSSQPNRGRPSRGRPRGRPRGSGSPRNRQEPRRNRKSTDLGTPEWERDSWDPSNYPDGFQPLSSAKKRDGSGIKRRGVSTIGTSPMGSSFQAVDPGPTQKKQKVDKPEKPRDEDGFILMPDGRRDGRSLKRKSGKAGKDSGTEQSQNTETIETPTRKDISTPMGNESGLSQSTPNSWLAVNSRPQTEGNTTLTSQEAMITPQPISASKDSTTLQGSEQTNATASSSSINGASLQIKEEHMSTPPNHQKVMKSIFPHKGYQ